MSLSAEVEEEYKEAFALFDKDSDGKLTKAEFIKIIENVGLENFKKRAEDMMADVGAGENITFGPFREAFLKRHKMPYRKKEIIEAFEIFDTEKTGKILDLELRQIFTQMNSSLEPAELERMIKECEPDAKGNLSYSILVDKMFQECWEP